MNNTERKIRALAATSRDQQKTAALHKKIIDTYKKHYKIANVKLDIRHNPDNKGFTKNQLFIKPAKETAHIPDVHFQHNAEIGSYQFGALTGKAPNHTSGLTGKVTRDDKFKTTPLEGFKQLLKSHDNQYNKNKARDTK
jgi:hypothetical protein